jgi:hypothetical protein
MTDILVRLINLPVIVQRGVAMAIALSVLLIVFAAAYQVTAVLSGQYQALSDGRITLAKLNHLIQQDKIRPVAPITLQTNGEASDFLSGTNDAVIQAALQSRLNAISSGAGAMVFSSGATTPQLKNGLSYVGLRATLEGETSAIYNTVLQLETTRPYLLIDEFTVRGPGGVTTGNGPVNLSVQLSFSGVRASPDGGL